MRPRGAGRACLPPRDRAQLPRGGGRRGSCRGAPLSPSRCAAATTHWLKGVPFMPATCFLLMPLHAWPGDFALPEATLFIAVTHCEKGVPLSPARCVLLSLLHSLPNALAFGGELCLVLGWAAIANAGAKPRPNVAT